MPYGKWIAAVAFAWMLSGANEAKALPIDNGDFEFGDLTSWVATPNTGAITVISQFTPPSGPANSITPFGGDFFARLTGGGAGKVVQLSQTFSMGAGGLFSIAARFLRNTGTLTTNDTAQLTLVDPSFNTHILYATDILSGGGSLHNDPWTVFSYHATETGNYTLTAQTVNVGTGGTRSTFAIDEGTQSVVPEPASLAILGIALFAAGAASRRIKKRAQV